MGSGLCRAWVEWDSGGDLQDSKDSLENPDTQRGRTDSRVWGHTCHCTPEVEVNFEASLGYMTRPCLTKEKKKTSTNQVRDAFPE